MERSPKEGKVTFDPDGNSPLLSSRSNHIYEVMDAANTPNAFLLFNPGIHYWVALDKLGIDIIRALDQPMNISGLKHKLRKQQDPIDAQVFESEVMPLLDQLIALKFVHLSEAPHERNWDQSDISLESSDHYPFQDLIISLSDRCNLACRYCFNAGSRKIRLNQGKQVRRIDRGIVNKLCRDFRAKGGTGIIFTGGEPTLNPECLDFCADAKAYGLRTSLITNGIRLKKLDTDRLVAVVDALHVSIDSLNPKVNAALWGIAECKVQEDILSELANIGSRANKLGEKIRLMLKPTITRLNKDLLADMFLECYRRLSEFDYDFDITVYELTEDTVANDTLSISTTEFRKALKDAFKTYSQTIGPDQDDTDINNRAELFALTNAGKSTSSDRPCTLSCVPSLFVTNTGEAYPCQAFEVDAFKLGNVFEQSIDELFDNKSFRELRSCMTRDHIEVCKDCEFRYICIEHCHGESFKATGRTTAFGKMDTFECRKKMIQRLWLETQFKDHRS